MGSTIVCAVDVEDDGSRRPLEVAADLAERLARPLVVAYVAPLPGLEASGTGMSADTAIVAPAPVIPHPVAPAGAELNEVRDEARRRVERLLTQCNVNAAQIAVQFDATAAKGLRRSAEDCDAELLVIGSRGRGTVLAALLGSTSHALVGNAPCPVVVVSEGD